MLLSYQSYRSNYWIAVIEEALLGKGHRAIVVQAVMELLGDFHLESVWTTWVITFHLQGHVQGWGHREKLKILILPTGEASYSRVVLGSFDVGAPQTFWSWIWPGKLPRHGKRLLYTWSADADGLLDEFKRWFKASTKYAYTRRSLHEHLDKHK